MYVDQAHISEQITASVETVAAAGALIGAFNGFFHVKFKIPSFIVAICTMYLFRGLCAYLTTNAPVVVALTTDRKSLQVIK